MLDALPELVLDIVTNYQDYGLDKPVTDVTQVINVLRQQYSTEITPETVHRYFKEANIVVVVYPHLEEFEDYTDMLLSSTKPEFPEFIICYRPASEGFPSLNTYSPATIADEYPLSLRVRIDDIEENYEAYGFNEPPDANQIVTTLWQQNSIAVDENIVNALRSKEKKKRKGKDDAGAVSSSTAGALETFNEGTGQRESLIVPPESTSTDGTDNESQHKSLVFNGSEKPFYQQDYVQKAVVSCTVFADAMVRNSGIYQALHNPEIATMARNIHHKGIHKATFDLAKKMYQQSSTSASSSNTVKNVGSNQTTSGRRVTNTSSSSVKKIRSHQAAKHRMSKTSMEAKFGKLKQHSLQNSAPQSFKRTNLYNVSHRAASTRMGIDMRGSSTCSYGGGWTAAPRCK